MTFHSFQHNHHDSHIESFQLGPRQELTLDIRLDPVWNKGGAITSRIRFGGIKNYEEVCRIFEKLTKPVAGRFVDEIIGIKKTSKLSWILDLSGSGSLAIQCAHCDQL
jgi:hypothetical protein